MALDATVTAAERTKISAQKAVHAIEQIERYDLQGIDRQLAIEEAVRGFSDAILSLQGMEGGGANLRPIAPCIEAFPCAFSLVSPHIFRAELPFLPLLKTKSAADRYAEIFLPYAHKKLAEYIPQDFKKFRSAHVIFINFVAQNKGKKQAYFDNDNLAIKALLDAIVPYICFDDAAKYCNNLYLYQPSVLDKSELHIVQEAHLAEWIAGGYAPLFSSEFGALKSVRVHGPVGGKIFDENDK